MNSLTPKIGIRIDENIRIPLRLKKERDDSKAKDVKDIFRLKNRMNLSKTKQSKAG